ncbi:MAG TPA: RNA polymerase sigma-70 factor [Chryseolinea sp.]|nr:RNA polymerase sigma-70 factor [Chryseolinea sp.]
MLDSANGGVSENVRNLTYGDEAGFKRLFDTHWYELYEIAYKKLRSHDDAEEMVQSVFVEMWGKKDKLRIANIEHYLKVCLSNKCIDHIRAGIVRGKYADYFRSLTSTLSDNTEETICFNELAEELNRSVDQLPPKSREVFILSRHQGLTVKEIAGRMELSEKAVEYHITKALKSLKTHLKDYLVPLMAIFLS